MTLRPLVLLNIVNQHFETTVHSSVVEVEAEPTHFQRLPSPLMLPGIDTRIEHLEYLVVACEKCSIEDLGIPQVYPGLEHLRSHLDTLALRSKLRKLEI